MQCQLCGREVDVLTEHHLKPRSRLKKKETTQVIKICSACHRQLHVLFTNAELAKGFDSVERLRDEPRMAKFLDWVRKQDPNRQIKVRG